MTAMNTKLWASNAARMRYHLVTNPAPGGMPIIARAADQGQRGIGHTPSESCEMSDVPQVELVDEPQAAMNMHPLITA